MCFSLLCTILNKFRDLAGSGPTLKFVIVAGKSTYLFQKEHNRLKTCIISSFSRSISSTSTHVFICLTQNSTCKSQVISWSVEMYLVRPCWPFLSLQHKPLTAADAMMSLFPHNEERPQQISKQVMDTNMYNTFVTFSDLHFKQLHDKLPAQSHFRDSFREFGFVHFAYSKYMMARWYNPFVFSLWMDCTFKLSFHRLILGESSGLGKKSGTQGVLWSLVFWLTWNFTDIKVNSTVTCNFHAPWSLFSGVWWKQESFYSSNLHATFSHILTLLHKLLYFREEKN